MMTRMRYLIILLTLLLTACLTTSERSVAPVADINRAPPKMSGIHKIKPGESLYEIAWRYNRDFVDLAKINNLKSPYRIQAGSYVRLSSNSPLPKTPPVAKKMTPTVNPIPEPILSTKVSWEWPSSGKIIQNFSSEKGQKGIDIAGKSGQPVLAAAPGVVVYSGSGLRGYGQLIILKHNDEFLSAYAHNRHLSVKEGDWVKALQQIAEMGQTDTESVRLHFEIRRKGDPVNPLQYLPKR
jgi:lipoprotein NlpD